MLFSELNKAAKIIKQTKDQKDLAERKAQKAQTALDSVLTDFMASEATIESLQDENKELHDSISSLQSITDSTRS